MVLVYAATSTAAVLKQTRRNDLPDSECVGDAGRRSRSRSHQAARGAAATLLLVFITQLKTTTLD